MRADNRHSAGDSARDTPYRHSAGDGTRDGELLSFCYDDEPEHALCEHSRARRASSAPSSEPMSWELWFRSFAGTISEEDTISLPALLPPQTPRKRSRPLKAPLSASYAL